MYIYTCVCVNFRSMFSLVRFHKCFLSTFHIYICIYLYIHLLYIYIYTHMSCSLSLYIYTSILIPVTHLNHSMFRKWWFPKIGVAWNHPFCLGFSMINHPGVPPWLWKPPYMPLVRFCIYSKYFIFIYILYSTSILHLFNLFYRYYRYYRDFLDTF